MAGVSQPQLRWVQPDVRVASGVWTRVALAKLHELGLSEGPLAATAVLLPQPGEPRAVLDLAADSLGDAAASRAAAACFAGTAVPVHGAVRPVNTRAELAELARDGSAVRALAVRSAAEAIWERFHANGACDPRSWLTFECWVHVDLSSRQLLWTLLVPAVVSGEPGGTAVRDLFAPTVVLHQPLVGAHPARRAGWALSAEQLRGIAQQASKGYATEPLLVALRHGRPRRDVACSGCCSDGGGLHARVAAVHGGSLAGGPTREGAHRATAAVEGGAPSDGALLTDDEERARYAVMTLGELECSHGWWPSHCNRPALPLDDAVFLLRDGLWGGSDSEASESQHAAGPPARRSEGGVSDKQPTPGAAAPAGGSSGGGAVRLGWHARTLIAGLGARYGVDTLRLLVLRPAHAVAPPPLGAHGGGAVAAADAAPTYSEAPPPPAMAAVDQPSTVNPPLPLWVEQPTSVWVEQPSMLLELRLHHRHAQAALSSAAATPAATSEVAAAAVAAANAAAVAAAAAAPAVMDVPAQLLYRRSRRYYRAGTAGVGAFSPPPSCGVPQWEIGLTGVATDCCGSSRPGWLGLLPPPAAGITGPPRRMSDLACGAAASAGLSPPPTPQPPPTGDPALPLPLSPPPPPPPQQQQHQPAPQSPLVPASGVGGMTCVGWLAGGARCAALPHTGGGGGSDAPTAASGSHGSEPLALNLALMRWRLLPELDAPALLGLRVLLLGAGTLGCYVARTLLAWGVTSLTLVDDGRVQPHNPARQPLFEAADAAASGHGGHRGRFKAEAAAAALQRIQPGVRATGHVLSIPSPGHPPLDAPGATCAAQRMRDDVATLDGLVRGHDVVLLLTDTRESRWLPTVMAAAHRVPAMAVGLGFDSCVVVRHGLPPPPQPLPLPRAAEDTAAPQPQPQPPQPSPPSPRLSCYFCAGGVAGVGDSRRHAAADQACTVTRPGIAPLASALAVELLVATLHHPRRFHAPSVEADEEESDDSDECPRGGGASGGGRGAGGGETATWRRRRQRSPLGCVPQTLRFFLRRGETLMGATPCAPHCPACSAPITAAYRAHGAEWVLQVVAAPGALQLLAEAGAAAAPAPAPAVGDGRAVRMLPAPTESDTMTAVAAVADWEVL